MLGACEELAADDRPDSVPGAGLSDEVVVDFGMREELPTDEGTLTNDLDDDRPDPAAAEARRAPNSADLGKTRRALLVEAASVDPDELDESELPCRGVDLMACSEVVRA